MLGEPEWDGRRARHGAEHRRRRGRSNVALGVAAAEAFLGRPVDAHAADALRCPGGSSAAARSRSRSGTARTTPPASAGCSRAFPTPRCRSSPRSSPTRTWTACSPRSPPSRRHARRHQLVERPRAARAGARRPRARQLRARRGRAGSRSAPSRARRELAGPDGAVLVTGSLYLLADLYARQEQHVPCRSSASGSRVLAFAAAVVAGSWRRVRRRLARRESAPVTLPTPRRDRAHDDGGRRPLRRRQRLLRLRHLARRPEPRRSSSSSSSGSRPSYWVYKDARRRIEDPWLVGDGDRARRRPPFVGPLIYMLFRPPEYLEDVRERELEIKAMEERLARPELQLPRLQRRGRRELPRLPRLHDQAETGLLELPRAARADLADLPVLRDAGRHPVGRARARRGVGRAGEAEGADACPERPAAPAPDVVGLRLRLRLSRLPRPWRSNARSSSSSPTRSVAASAARSSRASSGAGSRSAARRSLKVDARPRRAALRRAQGEAVLRRARRRSSPRPDARARARGRGRDRRRPDDDGRDEPARLRAGHDPRRLRARAVREPRPRLRLAASRQARDRALVLPRRACLSSDRTLFATAPSGRGSTRSTPASGPREAGRETTSSGACGTCPRREFGALGGRRRQGRGRARLRHRATSPPGSRAAGARPSASTSRRRSSRRRGRCRSRPGSSSRSSRRTRPRPCRCRTRASTSSSPSTARASGSTRTAGSPRRLGCSGPAASSSSSATRRSSILCSPDEGPTDDRLHRRSSACTVSSGPGRTGVEFHLAHGDWIRLLRANGFDVLDLIELQAPPDADDHPYYDFVSAEWARRWPSEEIWKARLRA